MIFNCDAATRFRNSLYLHELVNGNNASIPDRRVYLFPIDAKVKFCTFCGKNVDSSIWKFCAWPIIPMKRRRVHFPGVTVTRGQGYLPNRPARSKSKPNVRLNITIDSVAWSS